MAAFGSIARFDIVKSGLNQPFLGWHNPNRSLAIVLKNKIKIQVQVVVIFHYN